jgi:pimeloyl-ACP methyl ester carboxylesterase
MTFQPAVGASEGAARSNRLLDCGRIAYRPATNQSARGRHARDFGEPPRRSSGAYVLMQPDLIPMDARRFEGYAGISLCADVGGDAQAPPVILMHGGGQTRHAWAEAAAALVGDGFHVVSLDLRGHGESDWASDGDYRLDAFVGDLKAVMSTLPSPPALVGASLGGIVSLLAAGECAQNIVSGLVLVDVTPRVEPAGADLIRGFMRGTSRGFRDIDEAAAAVASYLPHRRKPKDVSGLMKNLRLHTDGRLYWHWDPRIMVRDSTSQIDGFKARMEKALRNVKVPTLLIRGRLSELVSPESVAEFRALCPDAEYVDVPGAAHMVAGDRNTAFNDALIDFLKRRIGESDKYRA